MCGHAWPTCRPLPPPREGRRGASSRPGTGRGTPGAQPSCLTQPSKRGSCSPGPPLPERRQWVRRHPSGEPLPRADKTVSEVLALSRHLGHDRPALASPSAGVRGGAGPGPDRASPGKDAHVWPRASRGPWGQGRPGLGGGRRSAQDAGTVADPSPRPARCSKPRSPLPRGGEGVREPGGAPCLVSKPQSP